MQESSPCSFARKLCHKAGGLKEIIETEYVWAIHKLRTQARGRGLTKCPRYYISLCCKFDYGGAWGMGGRRVQNLQNPVCVVYEQPLSEGQITTRIVWKLRGLT